MGADFIYGVINSIDSERDPRNLLFIYEFMPSFIKKFPLKHLDEEMFEIFACYFPIDFNPAQNDPNAITRDLLSEKLANCLCASEDFTENCVNLALEKIDSQLNVAKMDSFELLNKCMQEFKIESLEPQIEKIWQALKVELLPGNNKDVAVKALSCIDSMIKCAESNEKMCEYILTLIFTSIIGPLSDPAARLFVSSVRIALICTSSTKSSAVFCANKLLPIFFAVIDSESTEIQQKCVVLELSQQIISICKHKDVLQHISADYINTVQKELIQLLVQYRISNFDALKVSFECLTKLSDLICSENRFIIYSTIKSILQSDNHKMDTTLQACIVEYAHKYPEELHNLLLAEFFETNMNKVNKHNFDIYSQLIFLDYFTGEIVEFIYKNLFESDDSITQIDMVKTFEDLLLNAKCENPKLFILALNKKFKLIDSLISFVKKQTKTLPTDLLYGISTILSLIVKEMLPAEQEEVIEKYLADMKLDQINDIYLTSGILGYLDESVALNEVHLEKLANELTKLSTTINDPKIQEVCNHLLCSLFNKMPANESNSNILKKVMKFLKKEIQAHNKKAVEALAWVSKGLLSRGHPDAAEIVQEVRFILFYTEMRKIHLNFKIFTVSRLVSTSNFGRNCQYSI